MIQKVFVTKKGNANFTCPECSNIKQMDVSKFCNIDKKVTLKVTCSKCKHKFSVGLERRQHVRKTVALDGFLNIKNNKISVKIIDISRLGLKIKTTAKLDLNIGDKLILDFVLDDVTHSKVSKEVMIKKMNEREIGVQFLSLDHYDKLGSYLLFQFS